MGRIMGQKQRVIFYFILVATLLLLVMSFSFTFHYSSYFKINRTIFQTKSLLRNVSGHKTLKHEEIMSMLLSGLSRYETETLKEMKRELVPKMSNVSEPTVLFDEENSPALYGPQIDAIHFILNDTINPVYDESGRCVIRILMFMLRKMIRRIGKYEGTYHCPELNCDYEISYSTKYEALTDKHIVVLFLRTKWEWVDLHAARPPNQIWVMYARESPSYDHCIVPEDQWYNTSYNWTMTYHEDAHFSVPYGRYIPGVPTVPIDDTRNWAEGKSKLSAWMASNCAVATYPRLSMIRKLSNHFQIDTYGACGANFCPKDDPDECGMILSRHKFYFSLENAECNQYITEKFWRNAYMNDIVPIVYGAPKRDYERFAPPNSFIYLGDFTSQRQLANYLLKIDRNDSLYNTFFEWRKHGSIELISFKTIFSDASLCKVVAKYLQIRQKDAFDVPDIMPDLQTWWTDTCQGNSNITNLHQSS